MIAIPVWIIPVTIILLFWALAFVFGKSQPTNFFSDLRPIFAGGLAIVGTLIVLCIWGWLR